MNCLYTSSINKESNHEKSIDKKSIHMRSIYDKFIDINNFSADLSRASSVLDVASHSPM